MRGFFFVNRHRRVQMAYSHHHRLTRHGPITRPTEQHTTISPLATKGVSAVSCRVRVVQRLVLPRLHLPFLFMTLESSQEKNPKQNCLNLASLVFDVPVMHSNRSEPQLHAEVVDLCSGHLQVAPRGWG
jgi:hypothetical protein